MSPLQFLPRLKPWVSLEGFYDQDLKFELFSLDKGMIKSIRLNNDVFVLNNDIKQNNEIKDLKNTVEQKDETSKVTVKKCIRCKIVKPVTDFFKSNSAVSGFQPYCKQCSYIANKKYKEKFKKNKGRPKLQNTKLIQWIDKKGKFPWHLDDFFKEYPECFQNKTRYSKQISQLVELHKIIQLDNNTFRRNI